MKIDMEKQLVILEEEYEASYVFNSKHALTFQDISLDDLRNELPERQPRYPFITCRITNTSIQMAGGSTDCFIFSSPV
ncbi:unnamed protein product, partial [Coregonus sp. 'balchen']